MNLLKLKLNLNHHSPLFHCSHSPRFLSPPLYLSSRTFLPSLESRKLFLGSHSFSVSKIQLKLKASRVSSVEESIFRNEEEMPDGSQEAEDLSLDGPVYQKTLRLVECAMFAALSGLAYFLSNSLAIENYFGCFFSLPIVISSLRWGIAAGRKTMVATAMLLLVLAGPVKALTYLLMHGFLGFAMGSLWRLGASWGPSISLCMLVRAVCAIGYVIISSFLIRENILALITINLHASISFIFTAWGISTIPSMEMIYAIFGTVLFLNVASYVFLLHILYSVFLTRLGMKASLNLPRWLAKAL